MKKRFYLFLLVVCMTVVLCACCESSTRVTLDDTKKEEDDETEGVSYKYHLYKTRNQAEYKSFYSSFDFDKYEIVDMSARLNTYMNGESYVIT